MLGVTDVGAYFPHRATYHPTCHSLRMLGVGDRPTRLLEAVRGIELVDLPHASECCGFGGTFALKNADTSIAMGADKARHVRDTGAEVLVAGDNSCLMHVGGMLSRQRAGVRVMHLAEVLASTEDDEGMDRMTGTFVGMPAFPTAAREALGDTQLRRNLAHATRMIRDKRAAVVAEVEDWEDLRLAGAAVKEAALRDLDQHLRDAGGALAPAARPSTGRATPRRRARSSPRSRRPTASTRSSRSSRWPPRRSASTRRSRPRGSRRGRPTWPSSSCSSATTCPRHILVPAIHRNRAEIREIFLRRMADVGRPAPDDLTDEPAVLAAAARLHLREKFLRAKVAVSGANFAVAETGTLVVVESEGNGRMCLTLPEVLVSVVGIEKVVADLGRPRPVPAAAAAVLDRRADEPLHLDVVRA